MPSKQSDRDGGQKKHDVGLVIFAIVSVCIAVLVILELFGPPSVQTAIGPVTRLFGMGVFGFEIWQLMAILLLGIGSWLLILEMQHDDR